MQSDSNKNIIEKNEYLTYPQTAQYLSVSLPTVKSFVGKGIFPCYRLQGTNRKYIKRSDIENAFTIIPIPRKDFSYEEAETAFRRCIDRGKILKKFEEEFLSTTQNIPPSISAFCQWLYLNKRADLVSLFNGTIQLSDKIKKNTNK